MGHSTRGPSPHLFLKVRGRLSSTPCVCGHWKCARHACLCVPTSSQWAHIGVSLWYVHMCVRVRGCSKSLLHHLLHHRRQVSPARARQPFLPLMHWAGPRRLKARPPPHQAPAHVSALSRGISPSFHRGLRKSAMLKVTQPARNPLLKPLPILLAGRTPARPPHSPPPWAPPRALCPVGQGL